MGRALAIILVIAAVVCSATNPSQDEYISWLKQQIAKSGGDQFGKALVALFGGPVFGLATTRKDFLVFSEFETDLGNVPPVKIIGVMHSFFPLTPLNGGPAPAHVVTTDSGGHWLPEDGYVWINNPPTPGDLRVRWQPGRLSTAHPHVIAASTEGHWLPEDGYVLINSPPIPGDLRVRWQPGLTSNIHPHVVASNAEGRWHPENGFEWVANPPTNGDFRVKRIELSSPSVTENQAKANCSYESGQLFCPGPGTGLCWAKGHDPYFNEPPVAIDVGTDKNSSDYGHLERCSSVASPVILGSQIKPSSNEKEAKETTPGVTQAHSSLAQEFAALSSAPHYLTTRPTKPSPASSSHCNTNPYLCTLYGLIMPEQRYPETARMNHIEGESVVAFWLDQKGNLIHETLYKSSGHPELDSEALAAVKRAAPFPPPPEGSPHGFVAQMEFPPK